MVLEISIQLYAALFMHNMNLLKLMHVFAKLPREIEHVVLTNIPSDIQWVSTKSWFDHQYFTANDVKVMVSF